MPSRLGRHPQVSRSMIQPCSSSTAHEAHDHNRNLLHHLNHSEQRYPIPSPAPSQADSRTANSSTSVTGGDEGKTDGGGCDAESDSKETDDEHEDDVAPSDSAIIVDDSQAGHTHAERTSPPTRAGQKRKRSVSLEGEDLAAVGPAVLEPEEKADEADEAEGISDADDYAGVDLISDSEERECTIEKLEERLIIASEEGRRDSLIPALDLSSEAWHGDSFNIWGMNSESFFNGDLDFFGEEYGQTDPVAFSNNTELDHPTVVVRDQTSPPHICNGRRVRFADSQSLSRISSVDDGSESPQDKQSRPYCREEDKPSNSRRRKTSHDIGNGFELLQKNSRNSRARPKNRQDGRVEITPLDQSFEGSYGNSSGYDSDLGETTEEDEFLSHRTQLLLRRASQSSLRHKRSQASKSLQRPSQKGQRAGPLMGTWIPASTKPIALMNKTCTSLIVFRIPTKAQTEQRTFHQIAADNSPVNTGFTMSYPSFSSDTGYSMNCRDLGASDKSSLEYAARVALFTESAFIPPQLLHGNPGISTHKHRLIDEDVPSPTTYLSLSELSYEGTLSHNEDSGENQGEPEDISCFLDFSNDSEGSGDDQEHLAATTCGSSPPKIVNPQNTPTEAQPTPNLLNHFRKGLATALQYDEYYQVDRTPFHQDGNTLDSLDFPMDHSPHGTNSASLSPDVRPSKKRRMSDGPSRAESIGQAKAALTAMS